MDTGKASWLRLQGGEKEKEKEEEGNSKMALRSSYSLPLSSPAELSAVPLALAEAIRRCCSSLVLSLSLSLLFLCIFVS